MFYSVIAVKKFAFVGCVDAAVSDADPVPARERVAYPTRRLSAVHTLQKAPHERG